MRSCAFTGHRPKSFPWKYNESAAACLHLKEALRREIMNLIDRGVMDFYTGLAEGVDTWTAEAILDLRKDNPALKLYCVLPCESQAVNWKPEAQARHQRLQKQADAVICLSAQFYKGCTLDRNRYMVDHADIILAVFNGSQRSGTGMTVRYAQKLGREIIRIDPKTGEVTNY